MKRLSKLVNGMDYQGAGTWGLWFFHPKEWALVLNKLIFRLSEGKFGLRHFVRSTVGLLLSFPVEFVRSVNLTLHFVQSSSQGPIAIPCRAASGVECALRDRNLSSRIVRISANYPICCEGDECGDSKYPPITPHFDIAKARRFSIWLLGIGVLLTIDAAWQVQTAVKEIHPSLVSCRLILAGALIVLCWPLIHAILDLMNFGCIYTEHLI